MDGATISPASTDEVVVPALATPAVPPEQPSLALASAPASISSDSEDDSLRSGAPTAPPPSLSRGHQPTPTPSATPAARMPTAQGDLASQPIPHVLLYVLDQALTGTLVFEEPGRSGAEPTRHRVFLLEGAPAQARISLRVSRLGEVLARLNLVPAAVIEGSVQQAAAVGGRRLLGELLLSKAVLSREGLQRALETQLVERLAALATLPKGTTYSFFADENLFQSEPGASELLTTSPLNALFATLRGSVDEERMMATLRRIWRIPLAFHPDADREAYALTGEEEAVLERIEHGRPTLDELLADRRVDREAAVQFVYFLAVTRQLVWKGQKKGPIMPRGSRAKTGFSPPLPPRTVKVADERVVSEWKSTKPRIRVRVATPNGSRLAPSGLPTPPVMHAVQLAEATMRPRADSELEVEVTVEDAELAKSRASSNPPIAQSSLAAGEAARSQPPVEFEHPNIVDPGAALAALVTGLRLEAEGDRDGASRSVRRATKLDPDEPEYAARLARLEAGSTDAAQLDRLHDEHPNHLVVVLEWARQQRSREHFSQALAGYRTVLARDITHVEAARGVLELLERLEQPE